MSRTPSPVYPSDNPLSPPAALPIPPVSAGQLKSVMRAMNRYAQRVRRKVENGGEAPVRDNEYWDNWNDADPVSAELRALHSLYFDSPRLNALTRQEQEPSNQRSHYPVELEAANNAWDAVSRAFNPEHGSPESQIKDWVCEHYPELTATSVERIAKVARWTLIE